MKFRKHILPRSASDTSCLALCLVFTPVTLVFELRIVLPEFHDTNGLFYSLAFFAGIFIVFNIVFNFLACILINTSIQGEILVSPTETSILKQWHFCAECEVLVPPRSWHCQICKTCILKRDHHCMFTGCCIGHRNFRYFLMFLIYMIVGALCSTIYSSIYLFWTHADKYANGFSILKMILPLLMFTLDLSWDNFYLLIYELNIIAVSYSLILITYYIPSVFVGAVAYERLNSRYDRGWRKNMEIIFGKRMHLTWLSPFIKSELPHDGIHWETVEKKKSNNKKDHFI